MIKILSLTQHLKDNKYEAFTSQSMGAESLILHGKKMHAQITWHWRTKWNLFQGIANTKSNKSKSTYFENNNVAGGFQRRNSNKNVLEECKTCSQKRSFLAFLWAVLSHCRWSAEERVNKSWADSCQWCGTSCLGLYIPFLFILLKNFNRSDSSGFKKSNGIIRHRVWNFILESSNHS